MTTRCTVVFGPGRSGTSVAMKLLNQAGLRLSDELEPKSRNNPDGYFEDTNISHVLQRFVHSLDLSPYAPRSPAWVDSPLYGATRDELVAVVRSELSSAAEPWGFKDPRVCLTWPMWQEIFASIDVEPTPVFCARDAVSVVGSLMQAYNFSQPMSEALFLYRCLHALEDVTEPWFFVQYSSWEHDGVTALTKLTEHCGIDTTQVDLTNVVADNYRKSLNRQATQDPVRLSGVVRELDELLTSCDGDRYDPEAIADFCASVHRRLTDFKFVGDALELARVDTLPPAIRSMRRVLSRSSRRVKRMLR